MQGFKCDRCGKWVEGTPANLGHHEWMFGQTDLYSMSKVSAIVRLTEFDGTGVAGADLCLVCFLYCLEQFLAVCYAGIKERRKVAREQRKEVDEG